MAGPVLAIPRRNLRSSSANSNNGKAPETEGQAVRPDDDGLTDRSKKFYDGTYKWDKWDLEGFTDDRGVYRQWGVGPDSGPPTPPPPTWSFSDWYGDANGNGNKTSANVATTGFHTNENNPILSGLPVGFSSALSSDSLLETLGHQEGVARRNDHPNSNGKGNGSGSAGNVAATEFRLNETLSTPSGLPVGFLPVLSSDSLLEIHGRQEGAGNQNGHHNGNGNGTHWPKTIPRHGTFTEHNESERAVLQGRLEGLLIGEWHGRFGLGLEEAYRQVGVNYPDEIIRTGLRSASSTAPPEAPPAVEEKTRSARSSFSNISGISDLSDPPSMDESPKEQLLGKSGLSTVDSTTQSKQKGSQALKHKTVVTTTRQTRNSVRLSEGPKEANAAKTKVTREKADRTENTTETNETKTAKSKVTTKGLKEKKRTEKGAAPTKIAKDTKEKKSAKKDMGMVPVRRSDRLWKPADLGL